MLKHSRKFKLVPVDMEGEEGDPSPPTPPVLTKLSMLDRELRMILDDPTLSEKVKMERYEATLMKWGKYYRQYQSTDNGFNSTFNSSTSTNSNNCNGNNSLIILEIIVIIV